MYYKNFEILNLELSLEIFIITYIYMDVTMHVSLYKISLNQNLLYKVI